MWPENILRVPVCKKVSHFSLLIWSSPGKRRRTRITRSTFRKSRFWKWNDGRRGHTKHEILQILIGGGSRFGLVWSGFLFGWAHFLGTECRLHFCKWRHLWNFQITWNLWTRRNYEMFPRFQNQNVLFQNFVYGNLPNCRQRNLLRRPRSRILLRNIWWCVDVPFAFDQWEHLFRLFWYQMREWSIILFDKYDISKSNN